MQTFLPIPKNNDIWAILRGGFIADLAEVMRDLVIHEYYP